MCFAISTQKQNVWRNHKLSMGSTVNKMVKIIYKIYEEKHRSNAA